MLTEAKRDTDSWETIIPADLGEEAWWEINWFLETLASVVFSYANPDAYLYVHTLDN